MLADFRAALLAMNVGRAVSEWRKLAPHLPVPRDRDEAEHIMHLCRLQMQTLPERDREWSERWLAERSGPSRIVECVGTSVTVFAGADAARKERARIKELAMADAVHDAMRDGLDLTKDAAEVRRRMLRAKDRA
jgi:hypothetical protein